MTYDKAIEQLLRVGNVSVIHRSVVSLPIDSDTPILNHGSRIMFTPGGSKMGAYPVWIINTAPDEVLILKELTIGDL